MEWADDGIVLAARKHGESAAIVSLLTAAHGRHIGLIRGGAGRRQRGVLQPGNELDVVWRARLEEHLGHYTVELSRARAASLLYSAPLLAGLASACAVTDAALPEREPHPVIHAAFRALLDALEVSEAWPAVYVRFEIGLLQELGFGLDLSRCAMTGDRDGLAYVSPKSGRAVTSEAGEPWKHKLLRLPQFLLGSQAGEPEDDDIHAGLTLSGHFLEHHVMAPMQQRLPAARIRLVEYFSNSTTTSGGIVAS